MNCVFCETQISLFYEGQDAVGLILATVSSSLYCISQSVYVCDRCLVFVYKANCVLGCAETKDTVLPMPFNMCLDCVCVYV